MALFGFAVVIAIASLLTPQPRSDGAGGAILTGAAIDAPVLALIEKSCRDCHSERTVYPWYSYVAPVSWLIRSDVADGRRRLNLSHWSEYSLVRRERSLSEIANQVKDGDMPPSIYTMIHRTARLSEADVDAIFRWTQAERARLISENANGH